MTELEFNEGIRKRTKQAREARGYTQKQMAKLLDIDLGKYKNYENRASPMPPFLLEKFLVACDITIEWLYWKKGRAPKSIETEAEERLRRHA